MAEFVKEQLAPIITLRGSNVHQMRRRHADPELSRLAILDVFIDVFGRKDLRSTRDRANKEAREWLAKQVTHFSDLCWCLLDVVCEVFAVGILLENNHIIVPKQYKDNPNALS